MEKTLSPSQQHLFPPLFIAVPEVAQRLGIGQTSVWMLIRDKKLGVVKIGRRTLIPASALQEFAEHLISSAK